MPVEVAARLTTAKLISAMKRHVPAVRCIGRAPRRTDKAFVYFEELVAGARTRMTLPSRRALHCLLLLQRNGSGEYLLPTRSSLLVAASTVEELAKRTGRLVRSLTRVPEQKIVSVRRFGRELEVLFLDDEAFRLPLDDECDWENLVIAPDRLSLVVPHGDSSRSFPWDGIRVPESHLNERDRTKRAIAGVLQGLRSRAGLTQRQVAEKAGLDRQTVVRLERGGHYPGLETLRKLARACGVTLRELLTELQPGAGGVD